MGSVNKSSGRPFISQSPRSGRKKSSIYNDKPWTKMNRTSWNHFTIVTWLFTLGFVRSGNRIYNPKLILVTVIMCLQFFSSPCWWFSSAIVRKQFGQPTHRRELALMRRAMVILILGRDTSRRALNASWESNSSSRRTRFGRIADL